MTERIGIVRLALFLQGLAACSASAAQLDPFLIVPGQQIGLVHLPAREADVLRAYGSNALPAEIDLPEGGLYRGTVLFPCDPTRTARIYYDRVSRRIDWVEIMPGAFLHHCIGGHAWAHDPLLKAQLPGDELDISQYDWRKRGDNEEKDFGKYLKAASGRGMKVFSYWHLSNGVRFGMSVSQLQTLNGRPFDIAGPEGDGIGGVSDWHGGHLSDCKVGISFDGKIAASYESPGKIFHSDAPGIGEASSVDEIDVYTHPRDWETGDCQIKKSK